MRHGTIAEAMHQHQIDYDTAACTCGADFSAAEKLGLAWPQHTAEHIVARVGGDRDRVAEALRDHRFFELSVASLPVCLCGVECLDGDMVRHIASEIGAAA